MNRAPSLALAPALALPLAAGLVSVATRAWAVETPRDVESDHVAARDDGAWPEIAVLLHPVAMATRWFGAEVDVAVSDHVIVSVEGEARAGARPRGDRASGGVAFFLSRAFSGFYLHPALEACRASGNGVAGSAVGARLTGGYAWSWPLGIMLRLGGGVAYDRALLGDASALALGGVRPWIDADVGWVF
jgi:hypothetical protein